MRYEIWLLFPLATVFILGAFLHGNYLKSIDRKLRDTAGCSFDMGSLKKALQINQGSNFNTILLSTWSLFFVSFAFLFFLTPTIFSQWNYFRLAPIASQWWGLMIFGGLVATLVGVFAFSMPRIGLPWIYQYYVISKGTKNLMAHWTPILLLASISFSLYLAAIYPEVNYAAWNSAYIALLGSLVLLILPLLANTWSK
jgi:hypothetical protein